MAAYRRVYDSRHLQADCQELGSAPQSTLGNRVSAIPFLSLFYATFSSFYPVGVKLFSCLYSFRGVECNVHLRGDKAVAPPRL